MGKYVSLFLISILIVSCAPKKVQRVSYEPACHGQQYLIVEISRLIPVYEVGLLKQQDGFVVINHPTYTNPNYTVTIYNTDSSKRASYTSKNKSTPDSIYSGYYSNGSIKFNITPANDTTPMVIFDEVCRQGIIKTYDSLGRPIKSETYSNAELNGEYIEYYTNWEIKTRGFYLNGKQDKEWTYYDVLGKLIKTEIFPKKTKKSMGNKGIPVLEESFEYNELYIVTFNDVNVRFDKADSINICTQISNKINSLADYYYNLENLKNKYPEMYLRVSENGKLSVIGEEKGGRQTIIIKESEFQTRVYPARYCTTPSSTYYRIVYGGRWER
jgi:hypothetical protein